MCREAATILCEIFGKPAVEPLIDALKDKNMVVRANAAYILGEIGDERAVEPWYVKVPKTVATAAILKLLIRSDSSADHSKNNEHSICTTRSRL
ncbi:MAG: hypothetical protein C4B59_14855 [Candidatus Methanogaster sp.]|uniref:Uncharacterized protein n=1 Tax=Candidatus Methanogaster sp. TaxID=3386292 RepID=A0AC61KYX8_9EURY|nr:MAG: hypothetical protein C4B59_14855 [ANME-2 cluster archaeon]